MTADLKYLWGDEVLDPIMPDFQAAAEFRKMNLMLSAWDFCNLKKIIANCNPVVLMNR